MGDIPSGPVALLFFNNVIFLSISRLDRLISDIHGTGLEHGLVKSCGAWSCPTFNFSAMVEKKQFITAVVGPLTSLSMQSIRECRVYNNWKVARLTPVFKKDDPTVMSNYRPLSLLSVPSKILESCVAMIWGCCTNKNEFISLESIHCRAARVIYNRATCPLRM